MKLIEQLIQILTEAPMSDEDRRDSEILRNIFSKRQNRTNAKLTQLEKDVLNKYGVDMNADSLMLPKGSYNRSAWVKGREFDQNWMDDKMNLADKLRKLPDRAYAQKINNTRNWLGYDDEARETGLGAEYDTRDWNKRDLNFQEKERFRNNDTDKYRQATISMKNSLSDRKWADKELAQFDDQKAKLDKEYQDKLKSLERSNKYQLDKRDRANKSISDIKNQFRKGALAQESLNESKWQYKLRSGKRLRELIANHSDDDEDFSDVLDAIKDCYCELMKYGLCDEDDIERWTEDFELEADNIENVDYELNNLYDFCDDMNVWIDI